MSVIDLTPIAINLTHNRFLYEILRFSYIHSLWVFIHIFINITKLVDVQIILFYFYSYSSNEHSKYVNRK